MGSIIVVVAFPLLEPFGEQVRIVDDPPFEEAVELICSPSHKKSRTSVLPHDSAVSVSFACGQLHRDTSLYTVGST